MTSSRFQTGRRRSKAVASALVLGLVVAVPGIADASVGTGIGVNPIRLASRAEPGNSYRLPSLYVVNTGTQAADYLVKVKRLKQGPGRDVPPAWVRFAHTRLRLQPRKTAIIPVRLIVPKQAAHGDYRSNVVVSTYTPRRSGGASLGAAAADELSFTIGSPGGSVWAQSWFRYLVLVLTATVLVILLIRRSGLHLRIEHH